jgi:serine/threonine protein kinase
VHKYNKKHNFLCKYIGIFKQNININIEINFKNKRYTKMPGTIGKWTIKRTLGTGASCKVKLAVDPDTNRQVAVKIMNDDMGD